MSDKENLAVSLLTAATAIGAGTEIALGSDMKAVHVIGTTTAGAGAATVIIEVSNDTTWPWLTAATVTLTLGTVATADGAVLESSWVYARARVSAISGTGASVSAKLGV